MLLYLSMIVRLQFQLHTACRLKQQDCVCHLGKYFSMLPDPPLQCVGSVNLRIQYVSGSDPRIHHGNGSPAEGNVSWSYETDPVKNQIIPEIFKRILKLPVLL